jgi:hypothetical protein
MATTTQAAAAAARRPAATGAAEAAARTVKIRPQRYSIDTRPRPTYGESMGRLVAILAAGAALLLAAAPAAADPVDTTPPGVPEVSVLTFLTQGVDRVMASGDESDLSDEWRISNSPVVDADGMLVHGVTTTAIMYDWDVTDPATGGNGADGPHDTGCSFATWPATGVPSAARRWSSTAQLRW